MFHFWKTISLHFCYKRVITPILVQKIQTIKQFICKRLKKNSAPFYEKSTHRITVIFVPPQCYIMKTNLLKPKQHEQCKTICIYFILFYLFLYLMFIQQRKDVSPRFPGSGHILKYMKIPDISWYKKGSNTQIRVVYSLSYYSLVTCSEVYYSTSHKNKCVIRSLSRMSWNRIVWVTLTGKIFLSYDISMRVHDSFMTIFCGGNNIAYSILSCNSYQGTLLQRHMVAVSSLSCWNAASLFTALHMQIVSEWQKICAWLMKASLCYHQIFSLNSDQQKHIVCNFINTF